MRFSLHLPLGLGLACCAIVASAQGGSDAVVPADDVARVGRMIYRHGLGGSGAPIAAQRSTGVAVSGAQAACANCHRRSGLGAVEGNSVIPPITGAFLFQPQGGREPYTDAALARAIREGVDPSGRPLGVLMPRFNLSDDDTRALVQYLKGLSRASSSGVTEDTIHFATVVAPEVSEAKRMAMLEVLNAFFEDRNLATRISPRSRHGAARTEQKWRPGTRWQLHLWELEGAPRTWDAQLRRLYEAQPVFAVVGGISTHTWEPVHRFCEAAELPCLFPTVDLPVVAEHDFYSIYFSRGVLLEAEILARHLADRDHRDETPRVVQVFRDGEPGAAAARSLRAALRQKGRSVEDRAIAGTDYDAGSFARVMRGLEKTTVLVLWLREDDLRALARTSEDDPAFSRAYLSAILSGGESASLPPKWKSRIAILYPYELPEVRAPRLAAYRAWRARHGIREADERVQSEAYFAAALLAHAMRNLSGNALRDYLVERIETMVGMKEPGSLYPRLGLGASQRFASKGGYIVRFASPESSRLVAESEWIAP